MDRENLEVWGTNIFRVLANQIFSFSHFYLRNNLLIKVSEIYKILPKKHYLVLVSFLFFVTAHRNQMWCSLLESKRILYYNILVMQIIAFNVSKILLYRNQLWYFSFKKQKTNHYNIVFNILIMQILHNCHILDWT